MRERAWWVWHKTNPGRCSAPGPSAPWVAPEAVVHEVEFAVGRDEGNGAVVLEPRQPHALVELDVLQLHLGGWGGWLVGEFWGKGMH